MKVDVIYCLPHPPLAPAYTQVIYEDVIEVECTNRGELSIWQDLGGSTNRDVTRNWDSFRILDKEDDADTTD